MAKELPINKPQPRGLMGLREYARHRGVSLSTIQLAIETGRISTVRDEKGKAKINPEMADTQYEANTDPRKQNHTNANQDDDRPAGGAEPNKPSFAQFRAVRESYQARLTKLEFEEKAGKLVDSAKVKIEAFRMARLIRDQILNIPDRIAFQLAVETDPHRIHLMLSEELRKALEALSNDR